MAWLLRMLVQNLGGLAHWVGLVCLVLALQGVHGAGAACVVLLFGAVMAQAASALSLHGGDVGAAAVASMVLELVRVVVPGVLLAALHAWTGEAHTQAAFWCAVAGVLLLVAVPVATAQRVVLVNGWEWPRLVDACVVVCSGQGLLRAFLGAVVQLLSLGLLVAAGVVIWKGLWTVAILIWLVGWAVERLRTSLQTAETTWVSETLGGVQHVLR